MSKFSLYPLLGMNTVASDAGMVKHTQNGKLFYSSDLLNGRVVDGHWEARPGMSKVADANISCLWYSERFSETFAIQGNDLVLVSPAWTYTVIAPKVGTEASFIDLNDVVVIATPLALYEWNGKTLLPLALADPAAPFAMPQEDGGLPAGTYAVAISYRRKDKESAVSEAVFVEVSEGGGITLVLPDTSMLEPSATHLSIYASHPNGGDLYEVQRVPVGTPQTQIVSGMTYGKLSAHRFLSAMPTGKVIRFWKGRLVTCSGNTLRFSEPLNYHLHDIRHGFVQLPARVTFVEPVDNGLWVGQTDGVIFLSGKDLGNMEVNYKTARAPISWSSLRLASEDSGDFPEAVVWLSENGYVMGGGDGSIRELNAGVLDGVSGIRGQTVTHDRFLLTLIY